MINTKLANYNINLSFNSRNNRILIELFSTQIEGSVEQLLWQFRKENHIHFLNSNGYKNNAYSSYDWVLAIGSKTHFTSETNSFEEWKRFYETHKEWMLGYMTYELKNQTENLQSKNEDHLGFPLLSFHIPSYLFLCKNGKTTVLGHQDEDKSFLLQSIEDAQKNSIPSYKPPKGIDIHHRMGQKSYLESLDKILEHIQYGDIFEMNFCQEFYAENVLLDPIQTYFQLNTLSPTPFSSFIKENDRFLISASPERYLKKEKNKLISQPIKGTLHRGKDANEDKLLIEQLQNDPKERGENLMIVDLVRNDLSKTAAKASVKVEELCEIYTYPQVHQMISTIVAKQDGKFHFIDTLKTSFPMGSMTGAPKVKSMELIERYETSKRGLFSGSVGYLTPDGDFDFSVIIRSMVYHQKKKYLSFTTGSAITRLSTPIKEYEECLLKAEAMMRTLKSNS